MPTTQQQNMKFSEQLMFHFILQKYMKQIIQFQFHSLLYKTEPSFQSSTPLFLLSLFYYFLFKMAKIIYLISHFYRVPQNRKPFSNSKRFH